MIYQDTDIDDTIEVLLWGVTQGPFSRDELPEEVTEWADPRYDYMMVFKASYPDGTVDDAFEMWYEDFDTCYNIKRHLETTVEPIVLEL